MLDVSIGRQSPFPLTDQLESTLIEAGGLHEKYGQRFHVEVVAEGGNYPVTLSTSGDSRTSHPFFRAGKYLILDPHLSCFRGDYEEYHFDEASFIEECKSVSEVIFLCDNRYPSLHFTTSIRSRAYYLPNTVGCMIALQELGEQLNGRTAIDVGSRNALLANTAIREGAEKALAIECDTEEAYFFSANLFPGIDDDQRMQLDRMDLNVKINGSSDQIEVLHSTLGELENRTVNEGIAIFNFPDYGMGYYEASPAELKAAECRLSSGMFIGYNDSVEYRESLIADVTAKFPGLKFLVASGGARLTGRYELMTDSSSKLMKEAERLGWNLLQTVVVAHPCEGNVGDFDYDDWNDPNNQLDDTNEFLTFIFERH